MRVMGCMRAKFNKDGSLRGKKNSVGGLACTVVVGGANGRYPSPLYPGPWKDWLKLLGYDKIPDFLVQESKLKPYQPVGFIKLLPRHYRAAIGVAHKPLPKWSDGLAPNEIEACRIILTIDRNKIRLRPCPK